MVADEGSRLGDFSRAIPLSEQTFTDRERILGPNHPDTLTSRNNLADAYQIAIDSSANTHSDAPDGSSRKR